MTISGTATDTGGTVAGVEVSTDSGSTWHPATGTTSWSYSWSAHGSPTATIMSRATDDSGNVETLSPSVNVNVACPCTLAGPERDAAVVDEQDAGAVEVGVRFKADVDGLVTGVRFYKASANTGTHVGNLWTAGGTRLATGTFSGETASGWQQLNFTTPVDITAGTTYVASYYAPRGHYSVSSEYYYWPGPVGGNSLDSPPLHAVSANRGGANGVFTYAELVDLPDVDLRRRELRRRRRLRAQAPAGCREQRHGDARSRLGDGQLHGALDTGGLPTRYVVTPFVGSAAQPTVTVTGIPPATSVKVGDLDPGTSYTFKVQAANGSGSGPLSAASNAVTPNAPVAPGAPTAWWPPPAPPASGRP